MAREHHTVRGQEPDQGPQGDPGGREHRVPRHQHPRRPRAGVLPRQIKTDKPLPQQQSDNG